MAMNFSLRNRWEEMSPKLRRTVAVVGGFGSVMAVLYVLVSAGDGGPDNTDESVIRTRIGSLLTDVDPRGLGMEGLATDLRETQAELRRMAASLATLQEGYQGFGVALTDQSKQLAGARDAEVQKLRQELAQLHASLKEQGYVLAQQERRLGELPDEVRKSLPAGAPLGGGPLVSPLQSTPVETPPTPRDVDAFAEFFEVPDPHRVPPVAPTTDARPIRAAAGSAVAPPPSPRGSTSDGSGAIRVIVADGGAAASMDEQDPGAFIPAGTILQGALLSGLDAPVGPEASEEPLPVLVRVKHEAILPNRYRSDVRECFLIGSGFGDLSSERVKLRGEAFTCVRQDGGVIEIPIKGFVVGEDGKEGMRGRLVSKQGQLIARAAAAGFFSGVSEVFQKAPVPVVQTEDVGNDVKYQSYMSSDAAYSAAFSGASTALEKVADFYLDLAEATLPVLELSAGRQVSFVLTQGVTLQLTGDAGAKGPSL